MGAEGGGANLALAPPPKRAFTPPPQFYWLWGGSGVNQDMFSDERLFQDVTAVVSFASYSPPPK